MKRAFFLFLSLLMVNICGAQGFISTQTLLEDNSVSQQGGILVIDQDPAIDSLISRSILANKKNGIPGVRIQIYYSSVRNAREESAKLRADFIGKFPEIISYIEYQEPGWYKVRVGNYRTKIEAYKDLIAIRKEFPSAYLVLTTIESPYKE